LKPKAFGAGFTDPFQDGFVGFVANPIGYLVDLSFGEGGECDLFFHKFWRENREIKGLGGKGELHRSELLNDESLRDTGHRGRDTESTEQREFPKSTQAEEEERMPGRDGKDEARPDRVAESVPKKVECCVPEGRAPEVSPGSAGLKRGVAARLQAPGFRHAEGFGDTRM